MTTNGAGDDGFLANLSDPTYDVTEGVAPPAHMHGQSHGNVRRFEHAGHPTNPMLPMTVPCTTTATRSTDRPRRSTS